MTLLVNNLTGFGAKVASASGGITAMTLTAYDEDNNNGGVSVPAGVAEGDLIFAWGRTAHTSGAINTPSGFTSLLSYLNDFHMVAKVADGTEGSSSCYAVTGTAGLVNFCGIWRPTGALVTSFNYRDGSYDTTADSVAEVLDGTGYSSVAQLKITFKVHTDASTNFATWSGGETPTEADNIFTGAGSRDGGYQYLGYGVGDTKTSTTIDHGNNSSGYALHALFTLND